MSKRRSSALLHLDEVAATVPNSNSIRIADRLTPDAVLVFEISKRPGGASKCAARPWVHGQVHDQHVEHHGCAGTNFT